MTLTPHPQFVQGLQANLAYWQHQVGDLADGRVADLRAEHDNLLQAVRMGLMLAETRETAVSLAVQLFPLIEQGGYWQAWLPILAEAAPETVVADPLRHFQLLNLRGRLLSFNSEYHSALKIHQSALAVAKIIAQPRPLTEAHLSLSIAYRFFCEYELAEEQGQLALHQTVILRDEQMRGKMLTTLGLVARVRGELETAVTRLRQALILSRQYDPPTLVARKLNNLATTLHLNEQIEAALRCCDEAAALLLNTASQLDKIRVANTRGACHFDLQAYPQAEKAFRHALVLLQRHPELLRSRALTLMNLGNALLKQSQLTEAATRLQQALPLWQQVNDEIHYANSLDTLGKVLLAQGEQATADRLFKQAVAIFDKFPDSVWVQRFRKN